MAYKSPQYSGGSLGQVATSNNNPIIQQYLDDYAANEQRFLKPLEEFYYGFESPLSAVVNEPEVAPVSVALNSVRLPVERSGSERRSKPRAANTNSLNPDAVSDPLTVGNLTDGIGNNPATKAGLGLAGEIAGGLAGYSGVGTVAGLVGGTAMDMNSINQINGLRTALNQPELDYGFGKALANNLPILSMLVNDVPGGLSIDSDFSGNFGTYAGSQQSQMLANQSAGFGYFDQKGNFVDLDEEAADTRAAEAVRAAAEAATAKASIEARVRENASKSRSRESYSGHGSREGKSGGATRNSDGSYSTGGSRSFDRNGRYS